MGSDLDLLDRFTAGDVEGFRELVRRYQGAVYGLAYRMTGCREDAEDVCQKTFLKVFLNCAGFERRSSFKTWVYAIAANTAMDRNKERKDSKTAPLDDIASIASTDAGPAEVLENARDITKLRRAVDGLPDRQRAALVLKIYGALKYEEIAEVMKCSVGTVKAHCHGALANLRKVMG
ncbi:MAG: RNA polymerase sigma factor [Deltaproteobacteria bacterium]|nr:RNA polymerase sigma factor [Deltaproteobacteria bacterium]